MVRLCACIFTAPTSPFSDSLSHPQQHKQRQHTFSLLPTNFYYQLSQEIQFWASHQDLMSTSALTPSTQESCNQTSPSSKFCFNQPQRYNYISAKPLTPPADIFKTSYTSNTDSQAPSNMLANQDTKPPEQLIPIAQAINSKTTSPEYRLSTMNAPQDATMIFIYYGKWCRSDPKQSHGSHTALQRKKCLLFEYEGLQPEQLSSKAHQF